MRAEKSFFFYLSFSVWFSSIYFLFFEITCPKHSRWSVGKRFIIRPFRVSSTIHYTRADSVCYFLRWTAKWTDGEWSKKEIKRSGDGMTEFSHSLAGPSSFFRGRRNCYTVTSNNNGAISPSLSPCLSPRLSYFYSHPLLYQTTFTDPSGTLSIHPSDLPCPHKRNSSWLMFLVRAIETLVYINRRRSLSNMSVHKKFVKYTVLVNWLLL